MAAGEELRGQRVVAQAAAAVHAAGAAGERQDPHATAAPHRPGSGSAAWNDAARVEVLEQVAFVRLVPADVIGRRSGRRSGGRRAADEQQPVEQRAVGRSARSPPGSCPVAPASAASRPAATLTTAANGNRNSRLASGWSARLAEHDGRQQVGAAVDRGQTRAGAVAGGDVARPGRREPGVDLLRDALGHARIGERRQHRLLVVGRARDDLREPARRAPRPASRRAPRRPRPRTR